MSNDGKIADDQDRPDSQRGSHPGGHGDPESSESPPGSAAGMLDWLTLEPGEREVMVWLNRQRKAARGDFVQAFGDHMDIEACVTSLIASGYIREDTTDSEPVYSVIYRRQQKRATRDFPEDIWSAVETNITRRKQASDDEGTDKGR